METYSSDAEDVDEQDLDEFEDANDIEIPDGMTLDRAIIDAQQAINFFFNNQFDEAKSLMTPYANVSIYHSLGHSVFLFLEAILTFDPQNIATASKSLKQAMHICNKFRKKNTIGESLGKIINKNNYSQYSEIEAHAELCHAECLLLKALLTFMEDETLSSFIKAGLKIRSCYNSYKDCYQILEKRQWGNSSTKLHFDSGIKMGYGTFNVMISMLPSKVIKLLEFIGFSGNKEIGLDHLYKGYEQQGLRQILCMMTLLAYNLIVIFVLTHRKGDLELCDNILKTQFKKHPDGVWFLFFKGRLEFMKGNFDGAVEYYTKSWKSQDLWPQFHHICFWELIWVHCFKNDWKDAIALSSRLVAESRWSRSLYSYQKAAIMIMIKDELTQQELETLDNLMKDVPKYKQRIAGKSLPMEKFAVKRATRYFAQKQKLILPVIELMYLWNMFKILANNKIIASKIYRMIERAIIDLDASLITSIYDKDNKAMLLLLKAACLRQMSSPLNAIQILEVVISMKKDLLEDTFIVPYAIVELALIEWESGDESKAINALNDAKNNYSGYSLESRLHFKIHTAMSDLKSADATIKKQTYQKIDEL